MPTGRQSVLSYLIVFSVWSERYWVGVIDFQTGDRRLKQPAHGTRGHMVRQLPQEVDEPCTNNWLGLWVVVCGWGLRVW
jgi:hypothetical protein